jgi:formate dehydrogenase major subunit
MFAEIDPVLARKRGIEDGGWMTVITPRAEIAVRALVTERMKPLKVEGRMVHQVAMPWHWGFEGPDKGSAANDLGALSGEPNVSIQESKAFACDVRAGREAAGTQRLAGRHDRPPGVAPNRDHPAEVRPHR